MKNMLVVYYSWSNGNTEGIARQLAAAADADIEKIQTVKPYTGSYDEVVAQGKREVDRGYLPPIKPLGVNIDEYDIVAIGTPTWWYTMAPAVRAFLRSQDWTGKTVIPFMTNGGWPGHVIDDIEAECTGACFPLSIEVGFDSSGGSTMTSSQREVDRFVEEAVRLLQ